MYNLLTFAEEWALEKNNPIHLDQVREICWREGAMVVPIWQPAWKAENIRARHRKKWHGEFLDEMGMERTGLIELISCRLWIARPSDPYLQRVVKVSTCHGQSQTGRNRLSQAAGSDPHRLFFGGKKKLIGFIPLPKLVSYNDSTTINKGEV